MPQNYEIGQLSEGTQKKIWIYQGSEFDRTLILKAGDPLAGINFSSPVNYSATPPVCHMRKAYGDASPYIIPVMSWVNAGQGSMRMQIAASVTTALSSPTRLTTNPKGEFEIEIYAGGVPLRVAHGEWEMILEWVR